MTTGTHVAEPVAAPAIAAPAAAPATPFALQAFDSEQILALQRTAGNAAVVRALGREAVNGAVLARDEADGGGAPAAGIGPDILAGKYDSAEYKPDGTGYANPGLDTELQRHGQRIGVDTTQPPGSESQSQSKPKGGDSGGKPVESQPPWVEAFQDYLSSPAAQQAIPGKPKTTTWSEDDKVAQRLLRIFLRRWTEGAQGYVPPAVAELYEHAGAFESNDATNEYGVGVKDAANWCAQASSSALAESMLKSGLRFSKPPRGRAKAAKYGISRQTEINYQAEQYNDWAQGAGKKQGGVLGADGARGAYLLPGDILSFYSHKHGPTSNGHVVTVASSLGQPGKVQIASGNAAGESVRMEEVSIGEPPPGFNSQSKVRPPGEKEIWIFSLVRASWLNAFVMWVNAGADLPPEMYTTFGVERCTPLDELYPPTAVPTAQPSAAAASPAPAESAM